MTREGGPQTLSSASLGSRSPGTEKETRAQELGSEAAAGSCAHMQTGSSEKGLGVRKVPEVAMNHPQETQYTPTWSVHPENGCSQYGNPNDSFHRIPLCTLPGAARWTGLHAYMSVTVSHQLPSLSLFCPVSGQQAVT